MILHSHEISKHPFFLTIRIGINYIYPFKYCREEKEFIESEIHENEDLAEQVYYTVYTVQCTMYIIVYFAVL